MARGSAMKDNTFLKKIFHGSLYERKKEKKLAAFSFLNEYFFTLSLRAPDVYCIYWRIGVITR